MKRKLNQTFSEIPVNRNTYLVHPNFRMNSYDKRNFLVYDVAIVAIKTNQNQESARIDLDTHSDVNNNIDLKISDSFECDQKGLSGTQLCFNTEGKIVGVEDIFRGKMTIKYTYYNNNCVS